MEKLFLVLMVSPEEGGSSNFVPLLILIVAILTFAYIVMTKNRKGKIAGVKKGGNEAVSLRTGLVLIVVAIIAVVMSQTADFSYEGYESMPNPFGGPGMKLPVTKYNTDLKDALLYGGLFVGLIGAVMAIVSKPVTQPITKVKESSKFCTNCGNEYQEIDGKSFCGICGNKL